MEGMELISFQIIAAVGGARASFMDAMKSAREGDFEKASECINQGEAQMTEGHKAHMEVLTMQANGEDIPFDLLLVHAEDQMMNTETIRIMAEEIISLYKMILKVND